MSYQPATQSRHAIGRCQDCGAQTTYYRGGSNSKVIRCPTCRKIAHKMQTRASNQRKTVTADKGDRKFTLIHDPRGALRDLWASDEPTFGGYEILSCMPYGNYQECNDYPFAPGCRFRGQRGGLYGVYITRDGRMIFGRVSK